MEEFDHQKKCFTIDEYLEMEDASIEKHEFHDGSLSQTAVYSTGRNLSHNVVKGDVYTFVNLAIRGANIPHMALNSDTKVRIEAFNRFVYPDVTISDGTPEYYVTPEGATRRDIIINPLVIFEVLSEDTRAYDKGDKFELYCTCPASGSTCSSNRRRLG